MQLPLCSSWLDSSLSYLHSFLQPQTCVKGTPLSNLLGARLFLILAELYESLATVSHLSLLEFETEFEIGYCPLEVTGVLARKEIRGCSGCLTGGHYAIIVHVALPQLT